MTPWQVRRLKDQLKLAESEAEVRAAVAKSEKKNIMAAQHMGEAMGLREAGRMLGKNSYEARRGTKDKSDDA